MAIVTFADVVVGDVGDELPHEDATPAEMSTSAIV